MTDLSVAAPATASRADPVTSVRRWVIVMAGVVFLALGIMDFSSAHRSAIASNSWPLDFDINIVAAQRLVDREPIYDRDASRAEGIELIGPQMSRTSHGPYSSYIGSPPIALTHVPFLAFDHDTAAKLFRFASLIEMLAALALAAWALSPPARLPALLFGAGAMFWAFPVIKSVALGQGNGLVMLGLAMGIWGISRERWGVAGIGLGLASVLKVSPVLLVVYLLIRGRRKPVWWAAGTAAVITAMAGLVGRPADLLVWLRDVTPEVSKGTMRAYNQSIVGALSRLSTGAIDLSTARSPGAWYLLAYVLWAAALFGLWRLRRGKPLDLLEFGILILVAVAAGPLSWDHYSTWALITVVLVADFTRWTRLRPVEAVGLLVVFVIGFAMFHTGVQVPSPEAVSADWWMRLYTVRNAAALLIYLGVAAWLLARSPVPDAPESEWPDERDTAVGTALPMVAGRVH